MGNLDKNNVISFKNTKDSFPKEIKQVSTGVTGEYCPLADNVFTAIFNINKELMMAPHKCGIKKALGVY